MDNNNKNYWENPGTGMSSSNNLESKVDLIIELLKTQHEEVMSALNNKTLDEQISNVDQATATPEVEFDSSINNSTADNNLQVPVINNEEEITPISDLLVTNENIVPEISVPEISLPENINTQEINEPQSLITKNEDTISNIEEAPAMVTPVMEMPAPVAEPVAPVLPTVEEAPAMVAPVMETPAPVAEPVAPVLPTVEEAPVMVAPVMETPAPVAEQNDTIEIIPLTFNSAKVAPADPTKTSQRTNILTEQQNEILKNKSINNANTLSLAA